MPDFLLELLSEEIPARMQPRAREDLAKLFAAEIVKAGITPGALEIYSTPRRLALIARDLPAETASVRDELKGPRTGAPPQALEGFLRKTGLTQDQLVDRDGVYYAVIDRPGRATAEVLAQAIPAIIRAFPWPKSMRWGEASASTESLRWVRPLQGIVALFDGDIVPCAIDGIEAGADTVGHRFHHPGRITIGSAEDYAAKLRACHVIVDHEERESIIALGATTAAAQAGLTLVRDEALLRENAGLTEWPVPLLGDFDPAFLEVPPEVIRLTMAVNQKYFACTDAAGTLAPAFICTANIEARDGGTAIVAGNRKVLAARLSDAKFFWEQDLKVRLEDQAEKLGQIVFHEKLGTVADKVDRVAKLARWLVTENIVTPAKAGAQESFVEGLDPGLRREDEDVAPSATISARPERSRGALAESTEPRRSTSLGTSEDLAQMAETAARLCKADLVTGMVGEFPELQGVMGGYYARAQNHPDAVADAIRDHYKPVGQGDDVPTAPVTVAVSLADKLDTLVAFFAAGEQPTGSKDPYAIRRSALAILRTIDAAGLRMGMANVLAHAAEPILHYLLDEPHRSTCKPADLVRHGFLTREPWLKNPNEVTGPGAYFVTNVLLGLPLLAGFFADRLKVQQREAGVRHDLIDAVFALGGEDDLVRLLARVKALQAFVETAEGRDLLAGYKRAANILKKEGWAPQPRHPGLEPGPALSSRSDGDKNRQVPGQARDDDFTLSYIPAPEEAALIAALDAAEPRAEAAVAAEDFEGAMQALATLRAPVDAFFDKVTVNDPDPNKREARLALLARMRDAVHRVADFSRIDG